MHTVGCLTTNSPCFKCHEVIEGHSVVTVCKGGCERTFHEECNDFSEGICDLCKAGKGKTCKICDEGDGELIECSIGGKKKVIYCQSDYCNNNTIEMWPALPRGLCIIASYRFWRFIVGSHRQASKSLSRTCLQVS